MSYSPLHRLYQFVHSYYHMSSSSVHMCSSGEASAVAAIMQALLSPSLRQVTVLPVREFLRATIGSRSISQCRLLICSLLLFLCLWTVLGLMVMQSFHGDSTCSTSLGCPRRSLAENTKESRLEYLRILEEIYTILQQQQPHEDVSRAPRSLRELLKELKITHADGKTFATKLRAMVALLEHKARAARIREYQYRHVASVGVPKHLHCLALTLSMEYTSNATARRPLPSPSLLAALVDGDAFHHFVLASDNVLAASVVAISLVRNARYPERVVLHVITDRKMHAAMHAWFALHPLEPAVVEVKGLHQFDWFARGRVTVMEAMEKDRIARSRFREGSGEIVRNASEKPYEVAAKLQAMNPKYNSLLNHIRIYLPELFPSLKKVVFLDDDIVVQSDLSPLWDIDLRGKVNGAVETCRGHDRFVMSKRLRSYLNFSHPLISANFDPEECAWAYGMNIFDLEAWRKTNISRTYHHWVNQNLKSDLSLWQLGTLPPGLIAFRGHVHIIDAYWHMLGLGYQENTSVVEAEKAAVVHFNGRAKPWLEMAFPELRRLWSKYIDFSDGFIQTCNVS